MVTAAIQKSPIIGRTIQRSDPAMRIPKIVCWTFMLFVFTLPFEAADLPFSTGSLTMTKITALMYFGCYFVYLFQKKVLPRIPVAMWWFLGYLAVYVLRGVFISDSNSGAFVGFFITLIQLIVLFWFSSSLLKDERLARRVLLSFAVGAILAALAMISGVSELSQAATTRGAVRLTAMGFNPNEFSLIMALATVVVAGVALDKRNRSLSKRLLIMAMAVPLLTAIVYTGSRGGALAVLMALALYAVPYRTSRRKMSMFVCATLAVVALVYMVASNPDSLSRWRETVEEGHSAGRDKIYSAAIRMIETKPLLGWGPVEYIYELAKRTGRLERWGTRDEGRRGAHNLYLHLLLEVGLVGALPFLVGLWLCTKSAWKARLGNWGMLPFALVMTILVGNLTHMYLSRKLLWLVLAMASATVTIRIPKQDPPTAVFPGTHRPNSTHIGIGPGKKPDPRQNRFTGIQRDRHS